MPSVSLKRHFWLWLGGGALVFLAGATAWRFAALRHELGEAQDARLARRVTVLEEAGGESLWRMSQADGTRISGDMDLPAYPWRQDLRPGDGPQFYYTQVRGRLMRAAALRHGGGAGEVVLQSAEPLTARLPAWRQLWSGPLPAFSAGVLAMLAVALAASAAARRWVTGALRDFGATEHPPAAAPLEIQPALDRIRELNDAERMWVGQQRRFLADAAHQLRTPMAVLRTQLQAALETGTETREALGAMLHTVDRATGLANQLLSLTRLDQLKRAGEFQPLAMAPAVREAVVELSPLLARKRLEFALDGDDFTVQGDAVMLGELLRNLLANAIHHSDEGAALGVILRGAPPLCQLIVWDQGPGIDDEVKPRLFTPFSASKGGVGLGLSICQQIAESMGATVRLFNRVEGHRAVGVDAAVTWKAP